MGIVELLIDRIIIPKDHLRSRVCEQKIKELGESIAEVGLLQPILVREQDTDYCLISGERRLRACQSIKMETIPAIVLSGDFSVRQIQIVENVQREDLNPIDRARVIELFMQEADLTKVKASKLLGIPRTTLTEWLAVLDLAERFQDALINNYYGGSSPLTVSHVNLSKRFAKKLGSEKLVDVVLDSVLYYGLTRSETRKVLNLVTKAGDISIEQAVRKIRLVPQKYSKNLSNEQWHVEKLVSYLSQSGDYLVKTKTSDLQELNSKERQELARQSKALQKLLNQVLAELNTSEKQRASY